MIKYIKKYFSKFKKTIIFLSILIIVSGIISLIIPSFIGKFIDLLIYEDDIKIIRKKIYIFSVLLIVNIINSYLVSIVTAKIQTRLCFSISFDIIEHLKKIPYLEIIKYDPLYLNRRINTDSNVLVLFFLDNYLNFFFKFITLIFSFYILCNIDITIAIILLFFVPAYILLYILLKNKYYKLNLKYKESQDHFFVRLTEQITNIKTIKIDSSFESYKTKVISSFDDMFKKLIDFSRISYITSGLDSVLSSIANILIFFVGGIKVINKELSIGEFTVITTYFNIIMTSISYYLNIGKSFQDCKSSFLRIQELLSIDKENNGNKFINTIDEINLKKISFKYNNKFIFNNFSFCFKVGNIYCIKGHNGVGKSTLLNIIMGLITQMNEGSVSYNQSDIQELDLYKIRKEFFSVVSQDYILKDVELEKILNNINEENLKANSANRDSNCINTYNFFIKKINVECSQNESNILSGGENQKLSIFKALSKNSKVLIMDEPTSSLDSTSISVLRKILLDLKKDKIIILVSHDKHLENICDICIDLNHV